MICDFCGFTAQVKAVSLQPGTRLPRTLLGASWPVQRERMEAHIYLPLFIVAVRGVTNPAEVYYLPSDLRSPRCSKRESL